MGSPEPPPGRQTEHLSLLPPPLALPRRMGPRTQSEPQTTVFRDSPQETTQMSQFGAEKFTTRSREAIEAAQLAATTAGHSTVEPLHLLVALLLQQDGTAAQLV